MRGKQNSREKQPARCLFYVAMKRRSIQSAVCWPSAGAADQAGQKVERREKESQINRRRQYSESGQAAALQQPGPAVPGEGPSGAQVPPWHGQIPFSTAEGLSSR